MSEGRVPGEVQSDWEECVHLLRKLPEMPLEERISTLELLMRNPSQVIRKTALRMGAALLPDDRLVAYLRNGADDVLRNAGLETLKLRGSKALNTGMVLLQDKDPDVVLQAVLILDHVRDPRGLEPLRPLLHHPDLNVVQAVLTALGHLGDGRTISDIVPFLQADPWLQMAAVQALGDLRSPKAIPHLQSLLPDLMLGSFAAEAIARIGGAQAFDVLAAHWLQFQDDLEAETYLGLMAHVLQGLSGRPPLSDDLAASLKAHMESPSASVRSNAANCAAALGPSDLDEEALVILGKETATANELPPCLSGRKDLCGRLLEREDPLRAWGFFLLSRNPESAEPGVIVRALAVVPPPECLQGLNSVFLRHSDPRLLEAELDLFLRLSPPGRTALIPALRSHRAEITGILDGRMDISLADRLVLYAHLDMRRKELIKLIIGAVPAVRYEVLSQTGCYERIVLAMPWKRWIEEDPEEVLPFLAGLAAEWQIRSLTDVLRPAFERRPIPALIRAMGTLGDRASVPFLAELLHSREPLMRAQAMESLGRIGGPDARKALSDAAENLEGKEVRLAFHALAQCSVKEDVELFRKYAAHEDWAIRMSCAQVLARYPSVENIPVLAGLAADPVAAVAESVDASVETIGGAC